MANNSSVLNTTGVDVVTGGKLFNEVENSMFKLNLPSLIFVFLYSILGVIGNSIVIYIYWKKWDKNKTRVFVLCLAIMDWINCAFNMPVELAVLWKPLSYNMHYLCKLSRGATFVLNNSGSLVLIAIAVERYIMVYYPLKARQLTPRFAKAVCLLACMIATVFSCPSFVFYGTHTLTLRVNGTDVQGKTCYISDEIKNGTVWRLVFTSVLLTLLIINFIILTILYIAIGKKIYMVTCIDIDEDKNTAARFFGKSVFSAITGLANPSENYSTERGSRRHSEKSNRFRNRDSISCADSTLLEDTNADEVFSTTMSSNTNSSLRSSCSNTNRQRLSRHFSTVRTQATRKNTVMMRMVTVAFMFSFLPFLIILVIRYRYPNSYEYYNRLDDPGKIVYNVFLRTYFINSMINPFIYGFMNLHFRKHVKNMFINIACKKCYRN